MRNKIPHIWNALWIAVLAGIHFSPAIASIGFLLIALIGVWQLIELRQLKQLIPYALLALVLLSLDAVNKVGINNTLQKLQLYLPWLLLPAMIISFNHYRWVWMKYIMFWILPSVWIILASIGYFIYDYEFYSLMVLESKPIPLYSEVYHIEFSFLVTIQIFLLLIALKDKSVLKLGGQKFLWILWAILVLGIHILSTRTGLLAFWIGIAYLGYRQRKSIEVKSRFVLIAIVALISSIIFIPTLKNRVVNTWEDLSAVVNGDDLNNKSFGQRWEAWNAASATWAENFLTGVGSSNLNEAMRQGYIQNKTDLKTTNQISPHNQYLQWAIEFGLLGLISWLLSVIWILKKSSTNKSWAGLLIMGLVACVFESLFERQAGMIALILLAGIIESTSIKK